MSFGDMCEQHWKQIAHLFGKRDTHQLLFKNSFVQPNLNLAQTFQDLDGIVDVEFVALSQEAANIRVLQKASSQFDAPEMPKRRPPVAPPPSVTIKNATIHAIHRELITKPGTWTEEDGHNCLQVYVTRDDIDVSVKLYLTRDLVQEPMSTLRSTLKNHWSIQGSSSGFGMKIYTGQGPNSDGFFWSADTTWKYTRYDGVFRDHPEIDYDSSILETVCQHGGWWLASPSGGQVRKSDPRTPKLRAKCPTIKEEDEPQLSPLKEEANDDDEVEILGRTLPMHWIMPNPCDCGNNHLVAECKSRWLCAGCGSDLGGMLKDSAPANKEVFDHHCLGDLHKYTRKELSQIRIENEDTGFKGEAPESCYKCGSSDGILKPFDSSSWRKMCCGSCWPKEEDTPGSSSKPASGTCCVRCGALPEPGRAPLHHSWTEQLCSKCWIWNQKHGEKEKCTQISTSDEPGALTASIPPPLTWTSSQVKKEQDDDDDDDTATGAGHAIKEEDINEVRDEDQPENRWGCRMPRGTNQHRSGACSTRPTQGGNEGEKSTSKGELSTTGSKNEAPLDKDASTRKKRKASNDGALLANLVSATGEEDPNKEINYRLYWERPELQIINVQNSITWESLCEATRLMCGKDVGEKYSAETRDVLLSRLDTIEDSKSQHGSSFGLRLDWRRDDDESAGLSCSISSRAYDILKDDISSRGDKRVWVFGNAQDEGRTCIEVEFLPRQRRTLTNADQSLSVAALLGKIQRDECLHDCSLLLKDLDNSVNHLMTVDEMLSNIGKAPFLRLDISINSPRIEWLLQRPSSGEELPRSNHCIRFIVSKLPSWWDRVEVSEQLWEILRHPGNGAFIGPWNKDRLTLGVQDLWGDTLLEVWPATGREAITVELKLPGLHKIYEEGTTTNPSYSIRLEKTTLFVGPLPDPKQPDRLWAIACDEATIAAIWEECRYKVDCARRHIRNMLFRKWEQNTRCPLDFFEGSDHMRVIFYAYPENGFIAMLCDGRWTLSDMKESVKMLPHLQGNRLLVDELDDGRNGVVDDYIGEDFTLQFLVKGKGGGPSNRDLLNLVHGKEVKEEQKEKDDLASTQVYESSGTEADRTNISRTSATSLAEARVAPEGTPNEGVAPTSGPSRNAIHPGFEPVLRDQQGLPLPTWSIGIPSEVLQRIKAASGGSQSTARGMAERYWSERSWPGCDSLPVGGSFPIFIQYNKTITHLIHAKPEWTWLRLQEVVRSSLDPIVELQIPEGQTTDLTELATLSDYGLQAYGFVQARNGLSVAPTSSHLSLPNLGGHPDLHWRHLVTFSSQWKPEEYGSWQDNRGFRLLVLKGESSRIVDMAFHKDALIGDLIQFSRTRLGDIPYNSQLYIVNDSEERLQEWIQIGAAANKFGRVFTLLCGDRENTRLVTASFCMSPPPKGSLPDSKPISVQVAQSQDDQYTMCCYMTDPIWVLEEYLEEQTGVNRHSILLSHLGTPLHQNWHRLHQYNIIDGSVLSVAKCESGTKECSPTTTTPPLDLMTIFVKQPGGPGTTARVPSQGTVIQLKNFINTKLALHVERQHLVYGSKVLGDNILMREYGLQECSTVFLYSKQEGAGGMPGQERFDPLGSGKGNKPGTVEGYGPAQSGKVGGKTKNHTKQNDDDTGATEQQQHEQEQLAVATKEAEKEKSKSGGNGETSSASTGRTETRVAPLSAAIGFSPKTAKQLCEIFKPKLLLGNLLAPWEDAKIIHIHGAKVDKVAEGAKGLDTIADPKHQSGLLLDLAPGAGEKICESLIKFRQKDQVFSVAIVCPIASGDMRIDTCFSMFASPFCDGQEPKKFSEPVFCRRHAIPFGAKIKNRTRAQKIQSIGKVIQVAVLSSHPDLSPWKQLEALIRFPGELHVDVTDIVETIKETLIYYADGGVREEHIIELLCATASASDGRVVITKERSKAHRADEPRFLLIIRIHQDAPELPGIELLFFRTPHLFVSTPALKENEGLLRFETTPSGMMALASKLGPLPGVSFLDRRNVVVAPPSNEVLMKVAIAHTNYEATVYQEIRIHEVTSRDGTKWNTKGLRVEAAAAAALQVETSTAWPELDMPDMPKVWDKEVRRKMVTRLAENVGGVPAQVRAVDGRTRDGLTSPARVYLEPCLMSKFLQHFADGVTLNYASLSVFITFDVREAVVPAIPSAGLEFLKPDDHTIAVYLNGGLEPEVERIEDEEGEHTPVEHWEENTEMTSPGGVDPNS